MSISDNLIQIQARIADAARRSGRLPEQVRLLAVTKTIEAERIREAILAGVTDIGENRVQEAESKFPQLIGVGDLHRHLIGHLQSNKTRPAVELFDFIHSIDSIKLAERLERIAAELGRRPVVLAQVDLGKEPTKTGIEESELV